MGEEIPKWIKCPRHTLDEDINSKMSCDRCRGSGHILNPKWVTCNMCGGNMSCDSEHDETSMYGTGPLSVSGGYFSPHLTDTTSYHFAFCERCLRTIWNQCKVKPRIDFYMGEDDSTYEEDEEGWKIGQWVKSGGRDRKLPTGICTRDEWCKKKSTHLYVCSGDIVSNERFCEEHAGRSGRCSNTMWLPAHGVRPVFKEDFTTDEWEALAREYLPAEYGEELDGKGYYSVWAAEIARAAVGLPKVRREDWGSAYSMLIVRDVHDVPLEMFKARSKCIRFVHGQSSFICLVAEVPMEDHEKIFQKGFRTFGMGQVRGWFEDQKERSFPVDSDPRIGLSSTLSCPPKPRGRMVRFRGFVFWRHHVLQHHFPRTAPLPASQPHRWRYPRCGRRVEGLEGHGKKVPGRAGPDPLPATPPRKPLPLL